MKSPSREERGATIRDVAKAANVSIATASYALNGSGRISEETRKHVQKIADDLGYSPSIAARALKVGKGNLIAILTDGFAGPWYGEILEGLQPTLKDAGFTVFAITLQKESLQLCMNLTTSGMVRGLIVLNPREAIKATLKRLEELAPVVIFDSASDSGGALQFVIDNRGGVTAVMEHLWSQGYRDYLWVEGTSETWDAQERKEAFLTFLEKQGAPRAQGALVYGGFQYKTAFQNVNDFLNQGKIPRAIVAANDESALGALEAVKAHKLRVPEDVAIAGFDGLDVTAWTSPPLTTLFYDRKYIGKEMAHALLKAIEEQTFTPSTRFIPVELVVRKST